jgi:hypothetical protein
MFPYLTKIFGIIRATNIRKVFEWYLNNGKDSPLLVTRDGFDQKHEFTKIFFSELAKYLVSHIQKGRRKIQEKFFFNHVSKNTRGNQRSP